MDLTRKEFWLKKLQPVKEKLWPYLGPGVVKGREYKATAKAKIYPYVKPALLRYRAFRAKNPVTARVALFSATTAFLGFSFVLVLVSAIYFGAFGKLPSNDALRNIDENIASVVYSSDEKVLGKYFIENRLASDVEDISPYIIDALVSTEDARFFEHGGVDFRAWVRVLLVTVLSRDDSGGGGSTLSQQLAKNLFPRKNHGLLTIPVAKIKEIFIAKRLEHIYDKNQLLALYLNKVPFGEKVFGIRMASKRFFNTTPKDIKVEDAAVLVGMLKATSYYNPRRFPERAKQRRNTVLAQMVKYQKLEATAFDSLSQMPIELEYEHESHDEGLATYFREQLRLELEKELEKHTRPDGSPYNIYTDGLVIHTTIDSRMQRYAEQAVNTQMAILQERFIKHFKNYRRSVPWGSKSLLNQSKKASRRYKQLKKKGLSEAEIDSIFSLPVEMTVFSWETETFEKDTLMAPLDSIKHYLSLLQTGFLAAEPQTGKILAWVGGTNFKYFKYDHIRSRRQVGSTFKPFVYAKALQEGVPPCERLPNDLVEYGDGYEPHNADGKYGGNYSMAGALYNSVNVVAVQLLQKIGIDSVLQLAKQMGITSKIPRELGIALGAADISLYEMVQAFSTFPSRGRTPELYYLTRIETADGEVLFERPEPDPKKYTRVLEEKYADIMNQFMQMVVDSGTAKRLRYLYKFQYPVAGKTGTTNNNTDGWFIGYTPTLITGAWVGAEQPAVHWRSTRQGQGAATALPICAHFLNKVYHDKAFRNYRKKVFAPLDSMDIASLQCPDFISQDSLLADSLRMAQMEQELSNDQLIQLIKDAFRVGNENRKAPDHKRDEASERVRKQNKKLERKRKRQRKIRELKEKIKGREN